MSNSDIEPWKIVGGTVATIGGSVALIAFLDWLSKSGVEAEVIPSDLPPPSTEPPSNAPPPTIEPLPSPYVTIPTPTPPGEPPTPIIGISIDRELIKQAGVIGDPHGVWNGHLDGAMVEASYIISLLTPLFISVKSASHGINKQVYLSKIGGGLTYIAGHGSTSMGQVVYEAKDGQITPNEIANPLTQKTEYLVYAGCCYSGYNNSMARAFLNRGTKIYVGFSSPIPDAPAKDFGILFLKKWLIDKKTAVQALDEAEEQYPSMYMWRVYSDINEIPPATSTTRRSEYVRGSTRGDLITESLSQTIRKVESELRSSKHKQPMPDFYKRTLSKEVDRGMGGIVHIIRFDPIITGRLTENIVIEDAMIQVKVNPETQNIVGITDRRIDRPTYDYYADQAHIFERTLTERYTRPTGPTVAGMLGFTEEQVPPPDTIMNSLRTESDQLLKQQRMIPPDSSNIDFRIVLTRDPKTLLRKPSLLTKYSHNIPHEGKWYLFYLTSNLDIIKKDQCR